MAAQAHDLTLVPSNDHQPATLSAIRGFLERFDHPVQVLVNSESADGEHTLPLGDPTAEHGDMLGTLHVDRHPNHRDGIEG
jgi:hypothetical protein